MAFLFSLLAAGLVITLFPSASAAQIFIARDANGTTVLSSRRLDRPTQVFHVPGAPAYRTTTEGLPRNAELFEELVQEQSQKHSLRPGLVRAVVPVEPG